MMFRIVATALVLGGVALHPTAALAQGTLAGLVKRLFDQATINERNAVTGSAVDHRPHFIVGESLRLVTRDVNVSIGQQLASFPLSSSSGGFSFSVGESGEIVPTSTTFGPAFAERALTIGKGRFNFGFSFQATSYDSFERVDLDSGDFRFIREHNDCCPPPGNPTQVTNFQGPAFERDLLQSSLRLAIDTRTTAFFGNVGVTNRFDVGFAVPIVSVDMEATVDAEVLRLGSAANQAIHVFPGTPLCSAGATTTCTENGSATGIGDVLLRAKYNVYRDANSAVAGALDLRLPTGDEDDLLGTGATQAHLFVVASAEYGIFSPHVNFGYTFSSGEASAEAANFDFDAATYGLDPSAINARTAGIDLEVPDEINYVAGVSVGVTPRITAGFDVRGRNIRDVTRFELLDNPYERRPTDSATFTSQNEFSAVAPGNLNLLLGVLGGKFNLGGRFLLNATLLFPLSDDGLKPKPTPVIGFDYVF